MSDALRLARRVEIRCLFQILTANLAGAALSYVYFSLLIPRHPDERENLVSLTVLAGAMLLGSILGYAGSRRVFFPIRRWLSAGGPPSERLQRTVLEGPRLLASTVLVFWLAGSLVYGALNWWFRASEAEIAQILSGVALAGMITATLVFLLTERTFRPLFALALAGGTPPPGAHTPNIRARLALSWILGSAVPLIAIAAALYSPRAGAETRTTEPISFMVAIGLVVGGFMTAIAWRSLIDPLGVVRSGLARLREGDIDVQLQVDDGGEVGQLQAGFNQMVEGLRERERLQDLFGRHVGTEVARQALDRDPGLGGERLEASVLFVDVADSTAIVSARPAAQVVTLLNEFFSVVVRAAQAEDGWVNKFEGDGALCVFGVPVDHADHAARALRAARRLVSDLRELGVRRPELRAGVGVSSGPVVAGNVGAEHRYEYTVVGDPVHEAARLTELAKERGCGALASGSAVERAGAEGSWWTPSGSVTLRGRRIPTTVYAPVDGEPSGGWSSGGQPSGGRVGPA